ncbi:MAG: glycosyltransferase family 2 protein [Sulfuricurvum sp.]|nr:glycosyltransferase family 2 protein [Sulfuricurvum sp.]
MKFNSLCILIPVYNNPQTIAHVVGEVLAYNLPIIVVDDGSDVLVETLIERAANVTVVRHNQNQGKGVTLRTGALKAKEIGFSHCLTMDGDGQHFAQDISKFLELFEEACRENTMIIGVRDFEGCNPPKSSVIGRQIGNFWVWVESGVWVSDTQTGFRLYPVKFLSYPSSAVRYEFEIENLVKFLWSGGNVMEVMVKTLYDETRVTHFDKLKDNLRMIFLHAKLVILRLFLLKGILK